MVWYNLCAPRLLFSMSLTLAGKQVLHSKFLELDQNRDGKLDFDEMKVLLRKRDPYMSDPELHVLYNGIDSSHDGFIDSREFLDYVLATEASELKRQNGHEPEQHDKTESYGLPNMIAPIPSIRPFQTRAARRASASARRKHCGPTILDGTGFQDGLRHSMHYRENTSINADGQALQGTAHRMQHSKQVDPIKAPRSRTPSSFPQHRSPCPSGRPASRGPERFFYDRSTYTGVHQHGGPSSIDGNGWVSSMRAGHHQGSTFTRTAGHPLNSNGPRCI